MLGHLEGAESVILFGIETHICVQQTALDLRSRGFDVHVVADGCSSRTQTDRVLAFEVCNSVSSKSPATAFDLYHHTHSHPHAPHASENLTDSCTRAGFRLTNSPVALISTQRMRQAGVYVSTHESILFELLGGSDHPNFKQVSALISGTLPESGLVPAPPLVKKGLFS